MAPSFRFALSSRAPLAERNGPATASYALSQIIHRQAPLTLALHPQPNFRGRLETFQRQARRQPDTGFLPQNTERDLFAFNRANHRSTSIEREELEPRTRKVPRNFETVTQYLTFDGESLRDTSSNFKIYEDNFPQQQVNQENNSALDRIFQIVNINNAIEQQPSDNGSGSALEEDSFLVVDNAVRPEIEDPFDRLFVSDDESSPRNTSESSPTPGADGDDLNDLDVDMDDLEEIEPGFVDTLEGLGSLLESAVDENVNNNDFLFGAQEVISSAILAAANNVLNHRHGIERSEWNKENIPPSTVAEQQP